MPHSARKFGEYTPLLRLGHIHDLSVENTGQKSGQTLQNFVYIFQR